MRVETLSAIDTALAYDAFSHTVASVYVTSPSGWSGAVYGTTVAELVSHTILI
jgi:hypothetical protein